MQRRSTITDGTMSANGGHARLTGAPRARCAATTLRSSGGTRPASDAAPQLARRGVRAPPLLIDPVDVLVAPFSNFPTWNFLVCWYNPCGYASSDHHNALLLYSL